MAILWLDLETYNETPITHGTYKYAASAEIIVFAWAWDDGPAQAISVDKDNGQILIRESLKRASEIWAHNSMFDRAVLEANGFHTPIEKWRDTMIQAYEHGLPGSLGELGHVLGLPQDKQKDKDGRNLIHLFCKPRPKNHKLRRATKETHPDDWQRFVDYARQDIEAMRACHKKMPNVNYPRGGELSRWHLDQKINDRGFCVDLELVKGALEVTDNAQDDLSNEINDLTDGGVTRATQRDKLLKYILEECGFPMPDMKKDTLERRLRDDNVPEDVKELLRIRLQAASSSTSKYKSLLNATNEDGRCRGTIQFCGAKRTKRAAGRNFQPQNLPSRGLLDQKTTAFGIQLIRNRIQPSPVLYPNRMKLLVSAIRGCLVAPPGKKLVVADLANIEGRDACWITGEDWKVQAFKDYDNGTGPDLYKLAYSKAFKADIDKITKDQRQIGKVLELFLQYQGGVGAFLIGAETYGFDVNDLASKIYNDLPAEQILKAKDFMEWRIKNKMPTYGLQQKAFITCDVLKRLWRVNHPKIVNFWRQLEDSVAEAMDSTGSVKCGRHLHVLKKGNYLYIRLPSGNCLVYPGPKYKNNKFTFMGDNPYNRKYQRMSTYGGKLFENVCQSGSRDILYLPKPEIEKAGYKIVMHVHDELITECPDSPEFSADGLCNLMQSSLTDHDGLPLAAAGFETYRYYKG